MLQSKQLKPLYGFFLAFVSLGYSGIALGGTIPTPTPTPDPAEEEYPDSCLSDDVFFTGNSSNGDLETFEPDDSFYGGSFNSVSVEDLNEEGACSQFSSGTTIVGEDITRLMMTEYFHRMGQALQNRIRSGFFGGSGVAARGQTDMAGRAAGDAMADWNGWSPWMSYGTASEDNDLSSTRYDASLDNVLFGMDYTYSDRMIFGISGSYENNDVNTAFNLGELEVEGLTIAPYAAYLLTDNVSVDVAVGYSDLSIDQFRTEPGGAIVRGDTDASRWFVMSNLNANQRLDNWLFSGTLGVIYSEEDQDGFTETGGVTAQTVDSRDIEYGQLTFGGEIAYVEKAVEPYASVYYQYAFEDGNSAALNPNQAPRSNDDDDFRVATGLRFFADNGVSGVIEYNTILGRDNVDSHGIVLIGRYQF